MKRYLEILTKRQSLTYEEMKEATLQLENIKSAITSLQKILKYTA